MTFLHKILSLFKKSKYVYLGIFAVLILGAFFIFKNKGTTEQTIKVSHTDFINQVSVSGKVVAAEEVDLAFKNEGRVERVFAAVGDMVKSGVLIAKIDDKDAEKAVHDASSSLESAKLSLNKLSINKSKENLDTDLKKAYDNGFTSVSDAFLDLSTSINGLEDILAEDNVSENTARNSGNIAINYRNEAVRLFYKARDAFRANRDFFITLDRNSEGTKVEELINKTYETIKIFADAIKNTKNLVDYLADDRVSASSEYTTSKATLSSYTDLISGHLATLLSDKTNIKNYKDAFSTTNLDTEDLQLSVKQKENALVDAQKKLLDYQIRAPFDGIITKIDAKVGQIAFSNAPLVSLMSADIFQIESYVPEVSISQIELGDEASVTLDAYGQGVIFIAKVISIDPAETIRDGVSTYKIKLQFAGKDERIKSGMTANVSVTIFNKSNVIVVPGGVILKKDGKNFVQVKIDNKIEEREVMLGAVSSLGQVEVVSGLEDGDIIILNPASK